MSMSLSFTSAVNPAAIQPPVVRAALQSMSSPHPAESAAAGAAATLSPNSLNARNLLNTLVSDMSAAATPQGITRGQQPQQGDYTLALLAKDVYSTNG